ncbi:MAG: CBS domain-containing protein [Candidatus Kapaibacteriota bacterium]
MLMKTAEDIMIPLHKYPNIPKWFTIRQAIQMIQHFTINVDGKVSLPRSVLVTDENNQVVGMIRRRDILRGLEPHGFFGRAAHHPKLYVDIEPDLNLVEAVYDHLYNRCIKQADEPVEKYMQPIEHSLNYNDHLMKIIYMIDITGMSHLPVVKDNEVIGVVRTVEVVSEIAKMLDIE